MSVVRTILGDVPGADLGITYAHEHLVIDAGSVVAHDPELLLNDVDRLATELGVASHHGLRTAVDALPADAGRNVRMLADLSRRTGVHVIAATGLHHDRYYGPLHWSARVSEENLADLFVAEIEVGIDANDYSGPLVERTDHRAGIIKVAGSQGGPSARDARIFRAAAVAHRRTGAPIITHCEGGSGALEQVLLLVDEGVSPNRVILSHVDKVVDRGYHRELLATGATAEYDQSFRWGDRSNGTLDLLEMMASDGLGDRIVLGMDAARSRYYRAYGGAPGLDYLLTGFTAQMAARGLDDGFRHRLFVDTPARVLAFGSRAADEKRTWRDTRSRCSGRGSSATSTRSPPEGPMASLHLGIDLGATNCKWAVLRQEDGGWKVIDRGSVPTQASDGADAVVVRMAQLGRDALATHDGIGSIGIGVPGLYDPATGCTRFLPNMPGGWVGTPVTGPIGAALGIPTRLINDARAFGLAELRLGAARGASTMIGLVLGTGVGGVVVIDGTLLQGHDGTAGELGHQTIEPDGPACTCGNRGCLEAYARADQVAARCGTDSAEAAVAAARAGDARARDGLAEVGRVLGIGIANMVVALTPERVLLGGGVAAAGDLLLEPIRTELHRRVHVTSLAEVELTVAELGVWAGAIGAAIHGAEQLPRE